MFILKIDICFWSYLAQFFIEWKMFQTNVVEKIKTHILYSFSLFVYLFIYFSKILPFTAWKNIVEPSRPQMTTWVRMWIAWWVRKAKNTLSEYVIRFAFLLQQWLYESASLLLNAYIVYFVEVYWQSACYTRYICTVSGFSSWSCLFLFKRLIQRHNITECSTKRVLFLLIFM